MVVLTKADDFEQGHWRPWLTPVWPGPIMKSTVAFSCPRCDRALQWVNHTISNDGSMSPSCVCTYGCGFHDYVKLVS